jgi:hypothetical protein
MRFTPILRASSRDASGASMRLAARANHEILTTPAARRSRTISAPAAQIIGTQGRGAGCGVDCETTGPGTLTSADETQAGSLHAWPIPIGDTIMDNTGNNSKDPPASTQTNRRDDAGARRKANVTRNANTSSKLALIDKLNNTGPIEFISNLLLLLPAQ